MGTTRNEAIERLQARRATYVTYNERHVTQGFSAGLWDEEIKDCDIMIARLFAGLDLTPHQRGLE